jgi:hypothetical protein
VRRVVHCHRRPVQIAPAGEPEQTVSQIFSLEQDHHDKHDDQTGHCQGLKQWTDEALDDLQGFEFWPLDRYR